MEYMAHLIEGIAHLMEYRDYLKKRRADLVKCRPIS